PLGTADDDTQHGIDPAGAGVMVCGTSGSGKSTLTTAIMERLADAGYQILVVDPEGDYTNLDFAHVVGNPTQAPRPEDITADLREAVNVNVPKCPAIANDTLPSGDALLWHRPDAAAVLIRTKPPRTESKRHSRKYAEGNLGPDRSFYFRGPDGKLNLRASNLH